MTSIDSSVDVLAVSLELRVIPVKVVPVHLESAEFFGQSVFDVGRHETILENLDKRFTGWRCFLEVLVCCDTHRMPGEAYCHGVREFFGLSDLVDLM